ncbi:hypothetical protein K458DRAFT_427152 [Lentithecium fluviatile CBS 122367]|uniref:Myb-like DNA-binding domain-containing protein n=1 Tax=Lentithecium fluviatile CBS 122367 TaxID=1168545 RepID=A0A6G1JJU1_9PLEO|nr:hypothetical protein K458DRAFT_427152 [Lentithecium fluviatile CBS 122367]
MPTEEENIQYLYLVLTAGGAPTIDMAAISKALNVSAGATSKRWSRLKQAMEGGKNPGSSAYEFLWLCVKHSSRDKVPDWNDIAQKCGTTSGAASKRYSRMKQAFEKGDAAPSTPSKSKNTNNPSSPAGTTPTPKRKRAAATTPKKKPEMNFKPDEEEDEGKYVDKKPKRAKAGATKPKATLKSKGKGKETVVKEEQEAEEADQPAGFLVPNNAFSAYKTYNPAHLPTPTLSSSVNPTEATTFIKTDPDAPYHHTHHHPNGMRGPLYDGSVDEDQDDFYDAKEYFTQESELQAPDCQLCECRGNWVADVLANQVGDAGVHQWLEEF